MDSAPFRILLVDDQPALVWALSNFLKLADYDVLQAGSGEQALAALDFAAPHVVMAGWQLSDMTALDLCRRIRNRKQPEYVYLLLLTTPGQVKSSDLLDALQAGADDFLAQPIVHGEILSRLRAAARMHEFEHRLRQLREVDPLTGIAGRQGFATAIKRRLAASQRRGAQACVLLDIDFFRRINDLHGRHNGDLALRSVAGQLRLLAGDEDLVARLDGNRFGVLLAGAGEAEAEHWAERCRKVLAELKIALGSQSGQVTASFGVCELLSNQTAEATLHAAEQALLVAKQAGRNRVITTAGIAATTADRHGVGRSTDPLRSSVARDIMTSVGAAFGDRESLRAGADFLRDTRQNVLQVVDAEGKFVGAVAADELERRLASPGAAQHTLGEIIAADVPTYEEETTLKELYEFFQREDANRVEIVCAGRPTGYVTRAALAALGQAPRSDLFAAGEPPAHRSSYLLVPDLVAVDGD